LAKISKEKEMKLNAPKKSTWWVSVVIAALAIISVWIVALPFLTANAFLVLLVAFVILCLGTFVKGF